MSTRLCIHTANHLETLARMLARRLRRHDPAMGLLQPLRPEVIMVQSKGMQRWVSMAIARHNGICANMEFPFPNAFLEKTYGHVIGPLPEHSPFDPPWLTFRIMTLLTEMVAEKPFAMIRSYLSGAEAELKAFQLANRIADIFDQYLMFRPEMIKRWEKGVDMNAGIHHHWQSLLWRRLVAETATPHRADLQGELLRRLFNPDKPVQSLPRRVSVFGISHLPPFHLQVLEALGRRIPVDLYLLNPCREYWADIISDHQMIKARARADQARSDMADLHYARGNRLLSSWGQQGRQFFGLIHQLDAEVVERFEDNSEQTLLGRIQQDILDLVDRPVHVPPAAAIQADGSLRLNVCHSPMREVEVLHDQLLDIMDADAHIFPGDILVMTPDIAKYAPYIHSVFGAADEHRAANIPYTVADQNFSKESHLVEGFLQLLQFGSSRFETTRVLDLLEYPPIRQRFGLQAADLPQVEQWVREVDIRWGWSGADRKSHGLPRFQENTWRAGLDRLLMGYAVLLEDGALCAGLVPHAGIEGGQAEILGRLIRFAETLYYRLKQMPRRAPLDQWSAILTGLVDAFLDNSDQFARDRQILRNAIDDLKRIASDLTVTTIIAFEVVHAHLSDVLERTSRGTGFLAGSVTFCAMLPMRSIPAKVICLLGMQHDAFPRDWHAPGFNLIAADPRPGDRSKRYDDKYLFLEALLSARHIFYISYVGRDIQDNAPIPPSVLVSELLEYVIDGMGIARKRLVTVHPLQGFAPAYFNGSDERLYSYSLENLDACRQLVPQARAGARPFFQMPLPPPGADQRHLELSTLTAFLQHPIKYLLERRLGVYLRKDPEVPQDRENFNSDALDRFVIRQAIFNSTTRQKAPAQSYAAVRAAGRLPHGTVGEVVHDQIRHEVDHFMVMLERHLPPQAPREIAVQIDRGAFHISGRIGNLYPQGRLVYRLANIRPKDMLALFVSHLALQVAPEPDLPDTSIFIGKDAVLKMGPVQQAASILDDYLNLFWEGRQHPLPLFPRTSHAYAVQRIEKNMSSAKALAEALKQWHGGYAYGGECLDPYINLCKETAHPLAAAFESLALQVYAPLITSTEKQTVQT